GRLIAMWLGGCAARSGALVVTLSFGVAGCRAELHGGAAALRDSLPAAEGVSAFPAILPDTAPHPARGFISLGPDVRTFRACGAASDAWIADSTGDALWRAYGRLAAKTYDPLYVEV